MFLFRKHQERSTYATHIRHNIPLGQSEMQSCHLILTEIEQLVDQIQQTLRIAVHQLQLAMQFFVRNLLHHTFHRRYNQLKRRTQLMADIRKKAEFHLAQLLPLLRIFLYLADSELITFPPLYGIK